MLKKIIKKMIIKCRYLSKIKLAHNTNITINSKFEGHNYLGANSSFDGILGFASYIGENCSISGKIGKYCSIASNVSIVNGFHPTNTCISSHPAFYSTNNCVKLSYVKNNEFKELRFADEEKKYAVIISDDVWIGYGSIILAGIRIGEGAVIAAGSVVTKDVEPYSLVGGNPASIIKYRFDKKTIDKLHQIKWCNLEEDELFNCRDYFFDIQRFIEKVRKLK